ncbi:MAG: TerB family tellurite resistance protein [Myxococcota bacterium]
MNAVEINPIHAAIVDGACLMTVIDGVLDPEEYAFLKSMIMAMLAVGDAEASALVEDSLARLQNADTQAFLNDVVARLPDEEHQHALLVALHLACVTDGEVHRTEVALLDTIIHRLDLSPEAVSAAEQQARDLVQGALGSSASIV